MEKQKKAKYFCENCGSEVPAKAKFCPKCGKFFSSVRCPECSYTGDTKEFIHGCPNCGYAMNKSSSEKDQSQTADGLEHKLSLRKRLAIKSSFASYEKKSHNKQIQVSGDVPYWLFGICLVVLGIILFAFYQKF